MSDQQPPVFPERGKFDDASSMATPPRVVPPQPNQWDLEEDRTHLAGAGRPIDGRGYSQATPHSIPPITEASQVPTYPHGNWAPSAYSAQQERFVAPPEETVKTRKLPSLKSALAGALAIIVLAVATGVIYVTFFRKPPEDIATKIPENTVSAKAKVLRGDEVVRQYLTALAAGDVDKVQTLGPFSGQGSRTLITKAAYAQSLKLAPITEISVPAADANATEIPARYKLGGQEINTRFRVRKQDNGSWQMERITATFTLQGTNVDHIPVKVNGVTVNWATQLELLPGSYAMSTDLPFITFNKSDNLTVLHLSYGQVTPHPLTPVLNESGRNALVEIGKRTLSSCLTRKDLNPPNCPLTATSSQPIDPQQTKWTLTSDPWPAARPGLNANDQSRADLSINLNLTLFVAYKSGGSSGNQPLRYSATLSAVMTVASADAIKPEWKVN